MVNAIYLNVLHYEDGHGIGEGEGEAEKDRRSRLRRPLGATGKDRRNR